MSSLLPITYQANPNNLGNSVVLTRAMGNAQQPILQARACQSSGQGEVTVTVGTTEEIFTPGAADYRSNILAFVRFGIGNANYLIEADVKTGLQLTLPAEAVTITVAQQETGAFSPERSVVNANIGERTRPSRHSVTRSYPIQTIASMASASFPVPPFAHSFFVTVSSLAANASGSGQVTITGANQSLSYAGGQTLQILDAATAIAAQATGGVILQQAARNVIVSNLTGGPLSYAVVYCLAV